MKTRLPCMFVLFIFFSGLLLLKAFNVSESVNYDQAIEDEMKETHEGDVKVTHHSRSRLYYGSLQQQERAALYAIYDQNCGRGWNYHFPWTVHGGRWDFDEPGDAYCYSTGWYRPKRAWHGISCGYVDGNSSKGYTVVRLNLKEFGVCGTLSSAIGQLKNLGGLDVSHGSVTALPTELGDLTRLSSLSIDSNAVTTLPSSLSRLTQMWDLNLGNNRLTSLPTWIGLYQHLVWLRLPNNRISHVPHEIGQLHQLTILDISHNTIRHLPREIGGLSLLEELLASANALTAVPNTIGNLTELTQVDLSENAITVLPCDVGQWTKVTSLKLDGNALVSLPPEIGELKKVIHLDLGTNKLTTLPMQIQAMTVLDDFFVANNQLTTLPPLNSTELRHVQASNNSLITLPSLLFSQCPNILTLDLSVNKLTSLPSSFQTLYKLQQLNLMSNQLTSNNIGSWFFHSMDKLEKLLLRDNRLTYLSSLPQSLKFLDISSNQLTSIKDFAQLNSLTVLRAADNHITSIPKRGGYTSAYFPEVTLLDLTQNQITLSVKTVLSRLAILSKLRMLFLENAFHANADNVMKSGDWPSNWAQFSSLVVLTLGGNHIHGPISAFPFDGPFGNPFTNLYFLDLSENELTGSFSSGQGTFELLGTLELDGNPNMASASGQLPGFLSFDDDVIVLNKTGHFTCPGIKGTSTSVNVRLDPNYSNFNQCVCNAQYAGKNTWNCQQCPANYPHDAASCSQGQVHVRQGWWAAGITPNQTITSPPHPSYVTRCPGKSLEQTNCKGTDSETGQFQCVKGSGNRYCSECDKGYHRQNRECRSCHDTAGLVTAIALPLVILLLLVWGTHKRPSSFGTVKIFVFYSQVMTLLGNRVISWPLGWIGAVEDIMGAGNGAVWVGIDCLIPDSSATVRYALRFGLTASVPFLSIIIPLLIMALLLLFKRLKSQPAKPISEIALNIDYELDLSRALLVDNEKETDAVECEQQDAMLSPTPTLKESVGSIVIFLLLFAYIPTSESVLGALMTEPDPLTHGYHIYLKHQPWILVTDPLYQYLVLPLAVVVLILYVIGFPIALAVLLYRIPKSRMLTALTSSYHPKYRYFELVIMIRRLLLVLIVASFRFDSSWIPVFVFLLVMACIVIELEFHPYSEAIDNVLEAVSLIVVLLSYLAGMLGNSAMIDDDDAAHTIIFVMVVNGLMIASFLGSFLYTKRERLKTVGQAVKRKTSEAAHLLHRLTPK